MAKGVKKIKWVGNSGVLQDFSLPNKILCIKPSQKAPFAVGEWYNETTEDDKRRNITWLWMDQKKRKIFNKTIKSPSVPFSVELPKKLCGSYAFYLEASLYGGHDDADTGLHIYGKCEEKIISSTWSKKENTADNSEINYGQNLFITLETEGLNGNTLTLELYCSKKSEPIDTVKQKCINGTLKGKFKTMSCFMRFPGLPENLESFYIKVIDIKGDYIKNASGSSKILSFNIIKSRSIIPVFEIPTNTAPLTIDVTPVEEIVKTEGIITAYFAKEEFTKETAEVDGQHEYKFANPNIKYDKNKIAGIIKSKVDALVKSDKKYAKLDDIKNALVEESYAKDTSITFNLCKLGPEYKKINSAPLEEEVYVVAKTFLLDGKEVSIQIKEKDAVLVDTNADVAVLESKEGGSDITTLKAVVESGIAKVKIKLRPKADEDLKTWKEKLLKGKKEEEYTYKFKNITTIFDDNKKKFAAIILNNAKEGKQDNTKIESGKTAFLEEVEKALESKIYDAGKTISFDTYTTQAENLWLKAECQGETIKHEKEFLKRDGEYFVIGKKCECEARVRAFIRMLRVGEGTGELIKSYDYNKKETIYIAHDFQKGYTTAFGGNEITDLSKHPEENYGGSTAAGAYQIMRYVWWELTGNQVVQNENGDYIKTGIREEYHDYVKKYNIPDYKHESQDKLCIIIMKHYCKKLIDTIIDNNIEKAIRDYASLKWASLPHKGDNSYHEYKGKPQPATPMKICIEHYENFLKDELNEVSNLHLKKGFLKEFGYICCEDNKTIKEGYDIEKAVNYVNANAEPDSLSKCALYVRKAINAGGIKNISGHAFEYYDTDKLVNFGFKKVGTNIDSIELKKGDIVAFGAVSGHSYGHIAMYNGTQWVSDFKQNSFWVANQYSVEKKYAIYRWE